MISFDNGYNSVSQQNKELNSSADTIYYDCRKIEKIGKSGKTFLIIWAIVTVALLAYVIIGNKGSNFVSALIWQAIFVVSFYLLRYSKIVFIKPFCVAGIFIGFSAVPSSLFNLQEYADVEVTNTLLQSILPSSFIVLFLVIFSIVFSKQQYDRKSYSNCTVQVDATVSRIKRSYATLGKLNIPVLSYSFNGNKYETVYNRPLDFSKNRYKVGQTAIIKINPANPSDIYVTPQLFNQVITQNEDIEAIVNEFKRLYENPEQYTNEIEQPYEEYKEYRTQAVETNTTYHNRKPYQPVKATPMSYIFLLWFILSIVIGFIGVYKNPFITLMAFGQIPLVIGVILFFGIGEGTTHSPTAGACAFFIGLVLVVFSGINLFSGNEIKLILEKITPLLIVSVFNIVGISLICIPLCNAHMNKKHHTESVTGYVIGLSHKKEYAKRSGMIDVYAPIYGYTYRGKKYITESIIYSSSDYPVEGSCRNIFISPDNPKEIYEPERSDTNTLIFILFGVMTSGMSLFAIFSGVVGLMI